MIKVLICDDQMIVCEGLARILGSDSDLEVVGVTYNGAEALESIPEKRPDLILMDLNFKVTLVISFVQAAENSLQQRGDAG